MLRNDPVPLALPPGVYNRGTDYQTKGRYKEANLVRWRGTAVVPVGGWEQFAIAALPGVCRNTFAWTSNTGVRWLAIGTTQGVWAYDGSNLYEIHPADYVSSPDSPAIVAGYGTGYYGTGEYGTPIGDEPDEGGIATTPIVDFGYVTFDAWGENLLFSSVSDGRLLEWNPNTPSTLAVEPAGAPTGIRSFVVTNERHVVVFGREETPGPVNNPRVAVWCSQEDNTDWTPTATNTAGFLPLATGGFAVRAFKFRSEVLLFTSQDLFKLEYVGYPDVYVIRNVSDECGLIDPMAVARSANEAAWLSPRGFFTYDGSAPRAIQCDVSDLIDSTSIANASSRSTVVMAHNENFNEFWCFYPSSANVNPDAYVAWAYLDGYWTHGSLDRTAWNEAFTGQYPVAAQVVETPGVDPGDPPVFTTRIYYQEKGYGRPNLSGDTPYVVTGPIELGNGNQFVVAEALFYDLEGGLTRFQSQTGLTQVQVGFTFYNYPNTAPLKVVDFRSLDSSLGKLDVRGCGRSVEVTVRETPTSPGVYWQWGTSRLVIRPGESR